jgi:hypothetical protein
MRRSGTVTLSDRKKIDPAEPVSSKNSYGPLPLTRTSMTMSPLSLRNGISTIERPGGKRTSHFGAATGCGMCTKCRSG